MRLCILCTVQVSVTRTDNDNGQITVSGAYRIQEANCCWRNNMQRRINFFVILPYVEHDTFVERRCHSLTLYNRLAEFIHCILDQRLIQNIVILLL